MNKKFEHTNSMSLHDIRAKMLESPPAPPSGSTMREWFAGLALANPELMKDIAPEDRPLEAVRLADELMSALAPSRIPTIDSMRSPTENELSKWEHAIVESSRETKPASAQGRTNTTKMSIATIPSKKPASLPSLPKVNEVDRRTLPSPTTYSSIREGGNK